MPERDGMTLDEVAQEIGGVSRERVRQIEKKALAKLKAALAQEGLTFADLCPDEVSGDEVACDE